MAERDDELKPKVVEEVAATKPAADVHPSAQDSDEWMDLSLSGLMDEHIDRDPAPAVEEFMSQAAEANEVEAESVTEAKVAPVPYISFEHVS
ncbi:MAG: hypothetical protein M3R43_11260, partial [Acidobacteriota bacterium]|nr:hypothetical protein [Acidobacteriota bacterium]